MPATSSAPPIGHPHDEPHSKTSPSEPPTRSAAQSGPATTWPVDFAFGSSYATEGMIRTILRRALWSEARSTRISPILPAKFTCGTRAAIIGVMTVSERIRLAVAQDRGERVVLEQRTPFSAARAYIRPACWLSRVTHQLLKQSSTTSACALSPMTVMSRLANRGWLLRTLASFLREDARTGAELAGCPGHVTLVAWHAT